MSFDTPTDQEPQASFTKHASGRELQQEIVLSIVSHKEAIVLLVGLRIHGLLSLSVSLEYITTPAIIAELIQRYDTACLA